MERSSLGWGAFAVIVPLIAACGEDELKVDVTQVSSENYCAKVAEVLCHDVFVCCTGSTIEKVLGLTITTTEATCRRDLKLLCEQKNYLLQNAIEKGTARVREDVAPACLQAFLVPEQRGCFAYAPETPWQQPCEGGLTEGLQPAGENCLTALECLPDHYCAADRKCKALPQLNEPCPSLVCAEGLYCESDGKELKCKARKSAGQECTSAAQCAKDHRCLLASPTAMKLTCQPLANLGQTCSGNADCRSGYCLPGLCADGKACYQDAECGGVCDSDPTMECSSDSYCPGKCATGGEACYGSYCSSGDVCQRTCKRTPCSGPRVCEEKLALVDYCEGPLVLIKTPSQPSQP